MLKKVRKLAREIEMSGLKERFKDFLMREGPCAGSDKGSAALARWRQRDLVAKFCSQM